MVQGHGRLGYLRAYMCGNAERAVRVGEIPLGMDVNSLNRPAGNDQTDAQQREKESPGVLYLRS
jgi:hypothetical protein